MAGSFKRRRQECLLGEKRNKKQAKTNKRKKVSVDLKVVGWALCRQFHKGRALLRNSFLFPSLLMDKVVMTWRDQGNVRSDSDSQDAAVGER